MTFDKLYVSFSSITNSKHHQHFLQLASKLRELTLNKLVGDLQVFKLHHLLSKHNQNIFGKGKGILLRPLRIVEPGRMQVPLLSMMKILV